MSYTYIQNNKHNVKIGATTIITNDDVVSAIKFCNQALRSLDEQTRQFDINIFEAMGMRNLSGIVGEYFGKSIQRFSHDSLHSNLHQDGYPDLLLTCTQEQKDYFTTAEYRRFYLVARNLSTQSINVDNKSVFFYGVLKNDQ